MTKRLERVLLGLNVGLVSVVLLAMASPRGVIGQGIRGWLEKREIRLRIADNWSALTRNASRLDDGVGAIQLIEFSDYQCPYCRDAFPRVDLMVETDSTIGVGYLHFPLPNHPMARGAARAAICAEGQGRFQQMHKQLFTTSVWQQDSNWVREAIASGIPDSTEFVRCLSRPATAERLGADMALANALELAGTPTFVGSRGVQMGLPPGGDLRGLIER